MNKTKKNIKLFVIILIVILSLALWISFYFYSNARKIEAKDIALNRLYKAVHATKSLIVQNVFNSLTATELQKETSMKVVYGMPDKDTSEVGFIRKGNKLIFYTYDSYDILQKAYLYKTGAAHFFNRY